MVNPHRHQRYIHSPHGNGNGIVKGLPLVPDRLWNYEIRASIPSFGVIRPLTSTALLVIHNPLGSFIAHMICYRDLLFPCRYAVLTTAAVR